LNPLPHQDNLHLQAADGWLGLGNWREAELELAQIDPGFKIHPLVLEIQYQILGAAQRWEEAAAVAKLFQKRQPAEPWGYFHLAYALHELKKTKAAYAALHPVLARFPDNWLMRYNLACYACQLGNADEAMDWLEQAAALAGRKQVRPMALEDKDLEPLWKRIRAL